MELDERQELVQKELVQKLAKNPKMQKAIKKILAPLKQKGDSLEIGVEGEEPVKISFEEIENK